MSEFVPQIPDSLYRKMVDVHGAGCKDWLRSLPELMDGIFKSYGLEFVCEMDNLSYNWVMVVQDKKQQYVLKLSPPNHEFISEVKALEAFNRGMVKFVVADQAKGFILLEYLSPGQTLASVSDDEQATQIAADLIASLPVKVQDKSFVTVITWLEGFDRFLAQEHSEEKLDVGLLLNARDLATKLLQSSGQAHLLHGDLHHYNILSAGDGWKGIDPKGVLGEPCYEVGALLRNPYPHIVHQTDLRQITNKRLAVLHHRLGFDKTRMLDWAIVQAMLSAIWFSEEDDWTGFTRMQHLAKVWFEMKVGQA